MSTEPANHSDRRSKSPAARAVDSESPPRAPLAFRVGVVGHKPNRLQHADQDILAHTLASLLSTIAEEVRRIGREHAALFAGQEPRLRAVSPLAEGADRLFARAALEAGFDLCCVLPFGQDEYEKDFTTSAALSGFRELLDRASTRFQLSGDRADEATAYGAGGRVVLNHSDIVVVVWDGECQGKRGGTKETFDAARRQGVPVIWLDARHPHAWQMVDALSSPLPVTTPGARLTPQTTERAQERLREQVREILVIPNACEPGGAHGRGLSESPEQGLRAYYAEREPRVRLAGIWTLFRNLVGDGIISGVPLRVASFEEAIAQAPETESPREGSAPAAVLTDRLRPFYEWPDKLAVLYSDRYRGAFILTFLLAAVAVGMALFPLALGLADHSPGEMAFTVLELVTIGSILWLVFLGRRRQWHERWIDYRLLAEMVRTTRLVAPLGGTRPFPQVPAHWASYGQPATTWMGWYVRAVERDLTLPSVRVDRGYIGEALDHLFRVLASQSTFHDRNGQRCERIHDRLHLSGNVLIVSTLLACGAHIVLGLPYLPQIDWASPMLTFFAAFLPALGAALAGIANQGEFRRIARRSMAMKEQLDRFLREAAVVRGRLHSGAIAPAQSFDEAAALSADAARLLINEVLDWRVVVLDRPLQPPV
jgi:hypothetical protein